MVVYVYSYVYTVPGSKIHLHDLTVHRVSLSVFHRSHS